MEIGNIIPHIEALIFASDKPLTSMEITELINNAFGFMEEKLTLEQIQTSIDGIREKYAAEFYPFEVRESGGGWQFLTKKDYHKTVGQLNGEKFLKRLSTAALETLSIVAYKQPITKGEIEAIRGVSSDYSIQKLLEKELIIITGRNEEMPGKPLVYSTSKTFMDYFGINSPSDLPKLKEIFAETLVEPTLIHHTPGGLQPESAAEPTEVEKAKLMVGENGELLVHEEGAEGQEGSTGQVKDDALVGEEGAATGNAEVADMENEEGEIEEDEETGTEGDEKEEMGNEGGDEAEEIGIEGDEGVEGAEEDEEEQEMGVEGDEEDEEVDEMGADGDEDVEGAEEDDEPGEEEETDETEADNDIEESEDEDTSDDNKDRKKGTDKEDQENG